MFPAQTFTAVRTVCRCSGSVITYEILEEVKWCCNSTLVDAGLVPVHVHADASIASTSTGYKICQYRVSEDPPMRNCVGVYIIWSVYTNGTSRLE
jgi:hypothetical protein